MIADQSDPGPPSLLLLCLFLIVILREYLAGLVIGASINSLLPSTLVHPLFERALQLYVLEQVVFTAFIFIINQDRGVLKGHYIVMS